MLALPGCLPVSVALMQLCAAVPSPKEAAHVFIRVKEDIGDYVVDPNSAEYVHIPPTSVALTLH